MSGDSLDIQKPVTFLEPLVVQRKTLMGPGPSNCTPRVLHSMSQPVSGHFHQSTFELMDEIKTGIQYVFQTKNKLTLALSAAGHSGLEAAMCNLIEKDDKVLIAVHGVWGGRAADIATRHGGNVVTVEAQLGTNFSLNTLQDAVVRHRPVLLFITQGESSTGVYQPLEGLGQICRRYNCLLVVDTVASLGGVPFFADRWCVDCVYTGSQKVLGAPPGITPISFSKQAVKKIKSRKSAVPVYYFDMNLLGDYWNCWEKTKPRYYHHTIPTTLLYGLREGLAQVVEEGLDKCIERHQKCCQLLHTGLTDLGFRFFVQEPSYRLPTVTSICVPNGVDWKKVSQLAMKNHNFEISGGLGPTVGKIFRIGVMGANATPTNIAYTLKVLEECVNQSKSKL